LPAIGLIVFILYSIVNFPIHFTNARDFSFKLIGLITNKATALDIPPDNNLENGEFPVVFKSSTQENQGGNNPFMNQRNNSNNNDMYAQLNQ